MRWANFFQRKAKDMAPLEIVKAVEPVRDELETLQLTVTMHQSRLDAMEQEAAQLGAQLGEISGLSSKLKVRISERDAGAAVQLDALERERTEIERRHEGLRLRIISLRAELAPVVRQASVLAGERDAERQDALVKKCEVEKDKLIEEILSSWMRSCEAAFDLMVMLDGGMNGQMQLDDEHRRQLFAMNTDVGQRLQMAALVTVNEQSQFQFARGEVFRQLRIIPARRKESLRAAG
jgi:hypothetical protein